MRCKADTHCRHTHSAEGSRWASTVEQLKADYRLLTGDMLLAAAFVSYAGPLSARFRSALAFEVMRGWDAVLPSGMVGAPLRIGLYHFSVC